MRKKIWAVFVARNREFYRDRGVMAWNFIFPFLIVLGFAYAFSGKPQDLYKVALFAPPGSVVPKDFKQTRYLQFIDVDSLEVAVKKVSRHKFDLLLEAGAPGQPHRYWVNSTSPKGYVLERLLKGAVPSEKFERQQVEGAEIRYVDWVIPGVICMNMMFSCLFGVGYVIVRYRKNGMLKRLKATPLRPVEFLLAQVFSRLLLVQVSFVIILTGCRWLVGFHMEGSYLDLFLLMSLGGITLIALGLVIAARVSSEEVAGGLLNMLTWPMMFLSGVWFSLEGAHPWLIRISQVMPLTYLIEGARAIMLDGAGLSALHWQISILGAMAAVFLALGSWLFRWE